MVTTGDPLYERATELAAELDEVPLGKERVRGAKRWAGYTIGEARAFLRDYAGFVAEGPFSAQELANMLANTCIETASFLFSAGAPPDRWRAWCALAADLKLRAGDVQYAMLLAAIARALPAEGAATPMRDAELPVYRDQAIQSILLFAGAREPAPPPVNHPIDDFYAELREAVARGDVPSMSAAVERIARFWMAESSYGRYEGGEYPMFEPEVNAVVAALVARGVELDLPDAKIRRFLQAGLE